MKNRSLRDVLRRAWTLLWGVSLVALPFLLLLPLGLYWLWQQGWLLWWVLGAAALALLGYLPAALWRLRRGGTRPTSEEAVSAPGDGWSPRDLEAWAEVQEIAAGVDEAVVTDRDRLLAAARRTIERVAGHYHPDNRDPIWTFTLPELLLLSERVSARLRLVLLDHVPGSHLIEAGHLLRAWEYRPMAATGYRVFRHLHNVWRVSRLVNPMTALLAEARQQIVGATLTEAGDYVRRQGARIWVEEVGRAAIELYSGRLRVDPEELRAAAAGEGPGRDVAEPPLPGPLRILIAGGVNAGKSSLVNALLGEPAAGVAPSRLTVRASAYRLQREGLPEGILVDTPGLGSPEDLERLADRAWESDCVIWVLPVDASPQGLDRAALAAIHQRFAADTRRTLPPILAVVSHIDRLAPEDREGLAHEPEHAGPTTGRTLRAATDRIAEDLDLPREDVLPARLDPTGSHYGTDRILAWLEANYPAARRARAQRLQLEIPARNWKRVLGQAAGAGRLLKRRILG